MFNINSLSSLSLGTFLQFQKIHRRFIAPPSQIVPRVAHQIVYTFTIDCGSKDTQKENIDQI